MARRRPGRGRIDSVHVAYVAVAAAMVTLAAYIPMFPVLGAGTMISAGMIVVPLVGILLGPTAGSLATAIGAFLGQIVAPYGAIFGLITFVCPTTSTLVAGLLTFKRWKSAVLVQGLTILGWYALTSVMWVGQPAAWIRWYFPYLHLASFASVLVLGRKFSDWIIEGDPRKMAVAIFLSALAGTLSEHMVGNAIYVGLYSGPAQVYVYVSGIYWAERGLGALAATFVGVPLLVGLRKARVELGPWALLPREKRE